MIFEKKNIYYLNIFLKEKKNFYYLNIFLKGKKKNFYYLNKFKGNIYIFTLKKKNHK